MPIERGSFSIASGGTTSDGAFKNGKRLVGLFVPTVDSTTITFQASDDGGTTWKAIHTAIHGSAPAALTLGTANTGDVWQSVPEEVGRISAVAMVRLVTAAQNGGARTFLSLWEGIR